MPPRIFKDRIIAYKKGGNYLAVSLEFDLLAEGNSIMQAFERLQDATAGYIKMCCDDNEPDNKMYRKSPQKYQNMYDLFIELSEKKRKKETEKKKEEAMSEKEISAMQRTYNTQNICHA